ncbi:MAG: hypothetical protein QM705_09580 [Ancrocorticia sp.]
MYRKSIGLGAILLAMGVLGGCAAESGAGSASDGGSTASSAATLAPTAGVTATASATEASPGAPAQESVDVNLEPRSEAQMEWGLNIYDPAAVAEASSEVVAGTIVSTDGNFVDVLNTINTKYTLKVEKVYKGDLKVGDEISVSLPGGSMTLGDYIAELDRLGRYDEVFPAKSEEFMKEKGIDPATVVDPRDQDPTTPVTHNLGSNPTSESLNAEVAPEAWVYFLNHEDDGTYYGSVLNHSLKYLKEGDVHSLNPDAGDHATSLPEAELGK